ncbi:iron-binding protein [Naganishia albida]|nr:iron-binding protein [Naganishia albida]
MFRSTLAQSANVLRRSSVVATPRIASRIATARPSAGVLGSVAAKRSYHDKVIDHYENPRNVGSLNKKDLDVGTGLVGAPACGDVMKLQIKVDDNGVIQQAVFKTFGCGSAIASSSYATELIRGMTLDQAAKVTNKTISKELALPPVKLHCSMLAEDAITSAIKDYKSKRSKATIQPPASASAQQTATA